MSDVIASRSKVKRMRRAVGEARVARTVMVNCGPPLGTANVHAATIVPLPYVTVPSALGALCTKPV